MYTTTSKQQEGCTFEDSHPKCFMTTNSTAKLSRGAVNRGDVHVLRASYTRVNSNTVCNYFNFCQCRKLSYRSWVTPLCILLSEPVSSRLLNSISTKLFHQNKQFNVYTSTSKQQEGSTCKNSYPKCFITTNFDKFHREER